MKSKIMKSLKITIVRKMRTQFAALPCALHPNPNLNPDPDLLLDDGDADDDVLARFLPPVAAWFRDALGVPTPAQRLGWPAIAAGRSTLIVAPTGSGKTLAAFLAALDLLWRTPRREAGVRILYISPLKALNEDIRRNLEVPLAGILERSLNCGPPLSPLQAAVRSGDTPARDRARLVRKPPDILFTGQNRDAGPEPGRD